MVRLTPFLIKDLSLFHLKRSIAIITGKQVWAMARDGLITTWN